MHNSLDSTFCRKCGTGVEETDVQEAKTKLEALVAKGNASFTEGRVDEALAIADSALISDPSSTSALWLKAICHERRGEIAKALECADRIVELNPDSELDRIRRNQLRTKLSSALEVYEKPDRRVAIIGASAAAVLVLCVGIIAANIARSRTPAEIVTSNERPQSASTAVETQPQAGGTGTNVANPAVNPGQAQPTGTNVGAANVVNPAGGGTAALGAGDVPPIRQETRRPNEQVTLPEPPVSGTLPAVGEQTPIRNMQVGPVTVDPGVARAGARRPAGDDPTETFGVQTDAGNGGDEDPGQIEIRVHNGASRPSAGSESSNGIEARTRTAYQAFQLGNYTQAATLFEQALRSGGDPVILNQRLGQTYERLGRTGDAVEAYRRAVQAGEVALSQGKANPSGVKSAVESSRQALRKLGG